MRQREAFLVLAAAEIFRDHLENLERITLTRRVN